MDDQSRQSFDVLISQALALEFSGWDFSFMSHRWRESSLAWDYRGIVRNKAKQASSLLDMGTGGGEFLSSLQPLPPRTFATEAYPPNIPVARARLEPLGVSVLELHADDHLPFENDEFELVINRHDSYLPEEVYRILKPRGTFLTQQVGERDNLRLNELLGAPMPQDYSDWNLRYAVGQLERAGFQIVDQQEAYPETVFSDVGAVVFYLKAIPWQIPDFTTEKYYDRLHELHDHIQKKGALTTESHRFLIEAVKKDC